MGEKNELLNVQIQYKLIEELKIANQKLQKQIEKEISLKKEIKKINSELEKNIAEQSKKNIQLSNSLHQHEAMASIGEISSGIAHDLNTPLGAIKTSAESIRFTLNDFFTNDLGNVSPEEFDIAYKRVRNMESIKIFLNSSVKKINAAKFNAYLDEKHPQIENKNQLSILFVNARVSIEETKMIGLVLQSKNPISFLRLIDHFQKVHSFIDTILHSSDRAGKVIHELSGVVRYTHYSLMITGPYRLPIVEFLKEQANESLQHAQQAGEILTGLDGHPSQKIAKIVETNNHSIKDILEESLAHEIHALNLYKELLSTVVDESVYLEEYTRGLIGQEEKHQLELRKMLKDFS